ncbi:MAG: RNA 2',3'-cyclic phosphodiesterase [Rhodospirillales bacterium]|nr:RNA 2',3'-cyclic phosphodiesterase [Rhodospirillales bacterium]
MRIFVALPLPKEVRQDLAGICGGIAGTRWIEPENFHLTLRFIGEIGRGQADDLHTELTSIRFPEIECRLSGIGTFERRGHVTMLWAGLDHPQAVIALHDRIEAAARRAGFPCEARKFKPHVTLSRFRPHSMPVIGPYLEMHNAFSSRAFVFDRFNLYQSRLGHGSAIYDVLSEYPLDQKVYYGKEALADADERLFGG